MSVHTVDFEVWVKLAGIWTDISASVLSVDVANETSGNKDNALAFGDSSDARATVELPVALALSIPDDTPIRIIFTVGGTTEDVFSGVVRRQDGDLNKARLECESFKALISTTRAHSRAFYRRPVATKTTATSIENPATPGYRAGLINWILWMAGGRPAEQDLDYPNATFYYSCEQAIIAPDWTWAAGEDGWAEALKLCQASGGQLYIARDGVVTYRQPLSFPNGSATFTFSRAVATYGASSGWFTDATYQTSSDQRATKITCSYTPRQLRPVQPVVEEDKPRLLENGKITEYELLPRWPLYDLEYAPGSDSQLAASCFKITYFDGTEVVQSPTDGYAHAIEWTAQRIVLTISNTSDWPFVIHRVNLRGEPITAGEPASVTVGSGTIERNVADGNPLVQTENQALRLAEMTLAFHSASRPLRTLTGCPPDIDRYEGETVNLTIPEWSLLDAAHLIVAMRRDDSNGQYSYDLVPVDGLPRTDEFYLVGTTDYTGANLKVGY